MEDLEDNRFVKELRSRYRDLFDHAASNLLVICAPKNHGLPKTLPRDMFESHILQASPFFKGQYETLNGKSVSIEGKVIETGKGFYTKKQANILFEELFYNSDYKSHQVLCIDIPLDRDLEASATTKEEAFKEHTSSEEQLQFLRSQVKVGQAFSVIASKIARFNQSYVMVKGFVSDTSKKIEAMILELTEMVIRDNPATLKTCETSKNHRVILVRAIQTYVLKEVHNRLYEGLSQMYRAEDDQLKEIMESRREGLSLRMLGLDKKIPENLDLREPIVTVAGVCKNDVPLPRLQALKITLQQIQCAVESAVTGNVALATDDLLPLLIYVLIQANPPNLFISCEYLKHFSNVEQSSDEWGFFVANLSAAIEYIAEFRSARHAAAVSNAPRMSLPTSLRPQQQQKNAPLTVTTTSSATSSTTSKSPVDNEGGVIGLSSKFDRHLRLQQNANDTAAVSSRFYHADSPVASSSTTTTTAPTTATTAPATMNPDGNGFPSSFNQFNFSNSSSSMMMMNHEPPKEEDLGDFLSSLKASDEVMSGSRW